MSDLRSLIQLATGYSDAEVPSIGRSTWYHGALTHHAYDEQYQVRRCPTRRCRL